MSDLATQGPTRRIRTSPGRYYEDFQLGDIYEHRPGRTLCEADNIWFNLVTMNQHPLHCDAEYAAHTSFGRPIVSSTFTLALVTGMSVVDLSAKALANLGWTDIRLAAPVFAGDTLYAESEVLALRESRSRKEAGIVTARTTGRKVDGTVVITFERTMLVAKRGHAPDDPQF
jgi:acyl dehydratase